MRIVKSMNFDAAHFLDHDPEARPYARLHGHSFNLAVEIEGELEQIDNALAYLRERGVQTEEMSDDDPRGH